MATKLLYMDDFDVEACEATLLEITMHEDGPSAIQLDQTCFYPRGGGQDWDTGTIVPVDSNWQLEVCEVRLNEQGNVHHYGEISGEPKVGDKVHCQVDKVRRNINTRLHSAGHVVDMAMSVTCPKLVPGKGAHYPHMSFVEYSGYPGLEIMSAVQHKIDSILDENITNTLRYVSHDELKQLCRHVPDNLPTNKPTRIVLYGDYGVPCGGTHSRQLKDIGNITITKVRTKKGLTKVSYTVQGIN